MKKKHNYTEHQQNTDVKEEKEMVNEPQEQSAEQSQEQSTEQTQEQTEKQTSAAESQDKAEGMEDKVKELQDKMAEMQKRVAELEDMKLRQMAEFDNYRRRTNKEKLDLMQTAGERIFKDMLPLVDDFERARDAMQKTEDVKAIREGIDLIYNKFVKFLSDNNVHPIETQDVDFSTDLHEAITTFAAGEDKKGKIIDCTQKGYTLGEKVIRFAKVVVGE